MNGRFLKGVDTKGKIMTTKEILTLLFDLSVLVIIPTLIFALSVGCFSLNNFLLSSLGFSSALIDGEGIVLFSGIAAVGAFVVTFICMSYSDEDKVKKK